MEILKKNLVSIILGVVAILAVVVLWWPMQGLYEQLSGQLAARVQVANSMESLARAQRTMPLLSPDQTTPDALDVFPTQPVIDAAQTATQQVNQEASAMVTAAVNANQHQLLMPGELPKPDDQTRYLFALRYQEKTTGYAQWQQILNSTTPPTADEIKAELDKLQDTINKNRLVPDPSGNGGYTADSQQEAQAEFAAESPDVEPRMEMERAQNFQVYLLPGALPTDPTITKLQVPAPDRICNAQFLVWIFDDVCNAIRRCNDQYSDPAAPGGQPQHDILHSAVKQLELIDLSTGGPVVSSNASDLQAGKTSAVPKVPAVSPSGRVCNALYDVIHFKVKMIVDAAKVPQILRELEVGQFITILNVQIDDVIDPAVAGSSTGVNGNQGGGFRFGNRPVVRLELDCEELFMHQWTDAILPDSMKAGLGKGSMSPDNGMGGGGPVGMPSGPGGPTIPGVPMPGMPGNR